MSSKCHRTNNQTPTIIPYRLRIAIQIRTVEPVYLFKGNAGCLSCAWVYWLSYCERVSAVSTSIREQIGSHTRGDIITHHMLFSRSKIKLPPLFYHIQLCVCQSRWRELWTCRTNQATNTSNNRKPQRRDSTGILLGIVFSKPPLKFFWL